MPRKPGQIDPKVKPFMDDIADLYFRCHASGVDAQGNDLGVKFVPAEAVRLQLEKNTGQSFTRASIENAIKYWRKSGRIRVEISSVDDKVEQNYVSRQIPDLSSHLIEKYALSDCRLVHGILSSDGGYASPEDAPRGRVTRDLGEAGGKFLTEALTRIIRETRPLPGQSKASLGICVGAGDAVRAAIEQISFRSNFKKALIDITPMTGLLGWRRVGPSPLANSRRLEYVFSGDARLHWYSTPAIIPLQIENSEECPHYDAHKVKEALENLPMVREVDQLRKDSSVYIFSVSAAPKVKQWASNQFHLISKKTAEEYETMPRRKEVAPVGAISGLVFNRKGEPIKDLPWLPMGVTMQELQKAARGAQRSGSLSVLIVGGHSDRIDAVKALLDAGCVNVLITDVYTAREL